MKKIFYLFFFSGVIYYFHTSLILAKASLNESPNEEIKKIKISFGSCVDFIRYPNVDIFPAIIDYKPDIFIWTGDFAYLDRRNWYFKSTVPDLDTIRSRFNSTQYHPSHMKMKSIIPTIGIWDDHDYGQNDGNKYNPHKDVIQQMYLDAIEEPANSERRLNKNGIYFSKTISEKIKIILLDCRFNKESWFEPSQDMLGDKQWEWLEDELNDVNVELFLIVSGIQIMPDDRFLPESWYVPSQKKLYALLNKYKKRILLISGDVHFGEIMKHPNSCQNLFEITSSGMSHYVGDGVLRPIMVNFVLPDTFNSKEDRFFSYNFGVLEILLNEKNISNSKVSMQIRDISNEVKLEKNILFRNLEFNENCNEDYMIDESRFFRFFKNLQKKTFDTHYFLLVIFLLLILGVLCFLWISCFVKISKKFVKAKME